MAAARTGPRAHERHDGRAGPVRARAGARGGAGARGVDGPRPQRRRALAVPAAAHARRRADGPAALLRARDHGDRRRARAAGGRNGRLAGPHAAGAPPRRRDARSRRADPARRGARRPRAARARPGRRLARGAQLRPHAGLLVGDHRRAGRRGNVRAPDPRRERRDRAGRRDPRPRQHRGRHAAHRRPRPARPRRPPDRHRPQARARDHRWGERRPGGGRGRPARAPRRGRGRRLRPARPGVGRGADRARRPARAGDARGAAGVLRPAPAGLQGPEGRRGRRRAPAHGLRQAAAPGAGMTDDRARWAQAAAGWERNADAMRRATMPVSAWILDAAAGTGDTGFLAAELVEPGGTLITSDFSPEMLTAAQRRAERLGLRNVRFRQIDAKSIDLPAASIDGVLCRWGYMLLDDPNAALRETRPVLRPGRRVALAAWAGPEHNQWSTVPRRVVTARGIVGPPDPRTPGQFTWAEEGVIASELAAAGFVDYDVDRVDFASEFASAEDWWATMRSLSGVLKEATARLDRATEAEIIGELRRAA